MKRSLVYFSLMLSLLALMCAPLPLTQLDGTRVFAQGETKRYVIVYHSQSSVPKNAENKVMQVGGEVVTRLEEVGAVVATSSNPNFAAEIANADAQVSDVAEDIEVQMIPSPEQMGVVDLGDGPVEAPGDDTQTGPEPLYRLQW